MVTGAAGMHLHHKDTCMHPKQGAHLQSQSGAKSDCAAEAQVLRNGPEQGDQAVRVLIDAISGLLLLLLLEEQRMRRPRVQRFGHRHHQDQQAVKEPVVAAPLAIILCGDRPSCSLEQRLLAVPHSVAAYAASEMSHMAI